MSATLRLAASPLLRSSLRPSLTPARLTLSRQNAAKPAVIHSARLFYTSAYRNAASSVAGKPGSANIGEVKENAKEEIKKASSDIAKAITGGNNPTSTSQVAGGSLGEIESTVTSLGGLAGNVPREAWIFGAAGFLPYIGTSLSTIYLARQAQLAELAGASSTIDLETALALLHHVQYIQISFGALILSFLGAIHWGFEFAGFHGRKGYNRYIIGTAPVLLGWPTLLLPAQMALAAQWAAFTLVWYIDSRATARGWAPKWYSTYRFGLTAVVGSCILLTLGASGYYTSNTTTAAQKLAKIKSNPKVASESTDQSASPKIVGEVEGEISTEGGKDAYVVFENEEKKRQEEEKKRKEEEEKQKKQQEEEAQQKKEAADKKAKEARDKAEGKS